MYYFIVLSCFLHSGIEPINHKRPKEKNAFMLQINTILNYKYLLLENAYLAYVLLKIVNNIYVNFYDIKWTLAFASDLVSRSPL